jgi:hypothetical protein
MQLVFLDVLQQGPAGAMHDALGYAGGTRRIHDVERMCERQLGELDALRGATGRDEVIQHHAARQARQVVRGVHIGHHHRFCSEGICAAISATLAIESMVLPL